MCGIAVIATTGASPCYRDAVPAMLKSLRHRGPDGAGIESMRCCVLGHSRLSIIDLSGGRQPMLAHGHGVSFNGEIYDYHNGRKEYAFTFKTDCDTENLLAAYDRYGEDMCRHLKGMFAFAIWDEEKQKLVCGRDRFGEKPLYFAYGDNGEFIVASEIKAILASGLLTPHIDRKTLAAYLRMGFVPEGMSMYREIRQLRPGHCLVWSHGQETARSFWTMPPAASSRLAIHDAAMELRRLLNLAVEECLVANVEVGLLLSGGLDSTTLAALVSEKIRLRAFAFGMAGGRNELPYARATAAAYKLPLVECHVDDMDFVSLLRAMPQVYDEPLADTSCLPTLMLCRHVAAHVKVAIGGDGGDELLGGYAWYMRLKEAVKKTGDISNGWSRYAAAHFQRRSYCSSATLREAELAPWHPEMPPGISDTVEDALRMDLTGFLPGDILKKTDRASMHYGLELRSPFLDVDVADFLLSLPADFKISGAVNKLLLREAFGQLWPPEIRARTKQGFGMDSAGILARAEVRKMARDCLLEPTSAIRAILPGNFLRQHAPRWDRFSWVLFILALWCEDARSKGWLNG